MRPKVELLDLGLIDFKNAWDIQTQLHKSLIEKKRGNLINPEAIQNTLILCEHPPVYTLGKSGSEDHLKWNESEREERGIAYYKINRGGDITHHGPGQLVVYPIFDLDDFFNDVHKYVRYLEEVVIRTCAHFGLSVGREKDFTGVWLEGSPKRKICAIGVHMSRWVTLHGLAFNVNNDLGLFEGIIPCGIVDKEKTITSLQQELGRQLDMTKVKDVLINNFAEIFEFEIIANE